MTIIEAFCNPKNCKNQWYKQVVADEQRRFAPQ